VPQKSLYGRVEDTVDVQQKDETFLNLVTGTDQALDPCFFMVM
jgi:hypothetical protein